MSKKAIATLLVLALLLPGMALAAGAPAGREAAVALLDQVFAEADPQAQAALVLQAAEAAPEDVEVLADCAQILFYVGQTGEYAQESEVLLRQAMALATGEQSLYLLQILAEQMIYIGRADEAIELIDEAVAASPDDASLQATRASALYFVGRLEESMAALDALIVANPENLDAQRVRASILLDEARWGEALEAYRQIQAGWPEYLDGLYGQYMAYIGSGDFERGLRAMDELLSYGVDDALWVERARIRLWKQFRPEEALADTVPLLRMDPEWIDAHVVKLASLVMLERYDEAAEVAGEVTALDEHYGGLLRSIVQMNEGKWAEAEETLLALTQAAPSAPTFWKSLAAVRLDGYDDAEGALANMATSFALAGGDGDLDMFLQLGQTYRRLNRREDAARAFAIANQLTYEDPAPLYYLTMTCLEAGQGDLAADMMAQMEKWYPGWYETMRARMVYDDVVGDAQGALDAYLALAEKFPFPAESMGSLEALLRVMTGDEAGLEPLRADAEADGAGAPEWGDLALALTALERLDEAEAALEMAKSLQDAALAAATPAEARTLRIGLLTTEAVYLQARGKLDAGVALLEEAATLGWAARELLLSPRYEALAGTDAFAALLEQYEADAREWDLRAMPEIPEEVQDDA